MGVWDGDDPGQSLSKAQTAGRNRPRRSAELDPAEEGEAREDGIGGRTPRAPAPRGCGTQRGPRAGGAVGAPARWLGRGKGVRWMEGWDSACKHSDME